MSHLKTLASQKALKVPRKEKVFIMKPVPGPHGQEVSIPLGVLLMDYLGLAKTRKEVKYILHTSEVLVDGRRIKDERFPVGLLDIVAIPSISKYYLIMVDSNARLYPRDVEKAKSDLKLCKLTGKTMVKGGKLQLNFYDGRNILVPAKDSGKYGIGGTAVVKIPENKITEFISLSEGRLALVAKGRHAGKIGRVAKITESGFNLKSLTTLDCDSETVVTNTDYIFIIGDKTSRI